MTKREFNPQPEMKEEVLAYLLQLSASLVLPVAIWLIAAGQIFTCLRGYTISNYQEKVEEKLCSTLVDKISEKLADLFPVYGITPSRNAPFPTILEQLLATVSQEERLAYLSNMYNSLIEMGIDSPCFYPIVQTFLFLMGGGGGPA